MRFRTTLPRSIYEIVEKVQTAQDKNKSKTQITETDEKNTNQEAYLKKTRIIDPVFISAFYGLYLSKDLPPYPVESFDIDGGINHIFGPVDISYYQTLLNNLMFCLWLKKNGYPEERSNKLEYRKNLYTFLDTILKDEYFMDVTLPFYFSKTADSPFIQRMSNSNFVEFTVSPASSPEIVGLDFFDKQKEFYDYIFDENEITSKSINEFVSLYNGESGGIEYKLSAFWSIKMSQEEIDERLRETKSKELRDYNKNASKYIIAKSLAGFLNTNGGILVIGIEENKKGNADEIIGIESEFDKLEDPTQDGYRRMIVDSIIRKYFDPNVYNHINDHFNIEFEECEGKSLCTIKVYPSQERVFLTANKERKFFIRTDAETRELKDPQELVDYCSKHFKL